MADNVIGIKFGVAGEGSISGESGKLIKSQLEQIAKAVNLQVKVNINKTHFKSQLTELKKEALLQTDAILQATMANSVG